MWWYSSTTFHRALCLTQPGVWSPGIWFVAHLKYGSPLPFVSVGRVWSTQMPDESILREKAREAVRTGKLPDRRPDRTWGGPGVGAPCSVCGRPVSRDELEFEIQFAHDGDNPGLDKFHVHIRCFAAWEFERDKTP